MQSSKVDFPNISKTEDSSSLQNSETDLFSKKKRGRGRKNKGWSKKEEDKILKYALKLSEREFQVKKQCEDIEPIKINEIEEVTVYKATEEDFLNPLKMFDKLWDVDINSTGIIKIIPPESWISTQKLKMENTYKPVLIDPSKKLHTRKQNLFELYLAKRFEHVRDYNYEEYHNLGKEIFRMVNNKEEGSVPIDKIETNYWAQCSDTHNPLTTYYAADIPMQKYFTKQELFDFVNNKPELDKSENFDLLRVNVQKNSLLQFTKTDDANQISGITIPWFYLGMLYSSFCWHTEDLYLYSLNYMHEGSPKIWYSISHTQKEKMDEFIKNKYFATLMKQPDLIHRLTVHINPLELIQNGIKVYRVVQNPGDMIITLPKGYHCGFSTGLNLAEATLKWLDYGIKAQTDYRKNNRKLPVFSMEWVIMQNYENLKNSLFDDKNFKNKIIKGYVNTLIGQEIETRISLETFFKINKFNYIIEEIEKDDNIEIFECSMCTYFGFLSQLQCNNCNKRGCLSHSIQCKCLPTDFTFRYRYLVKDLQTIKAKNN